jgi:hypothetical protein
MAATPELDLSELRSIGWRCWDPIGLAPPGPGFGDEYDLYLLELAAMLRGGAAADAAVRYLIGIETGHMGIGAGETGAARARTTVDAVSAYLSRLDAGAARAGAGAGARAGRVLTGAVSGGSADSRRSGPG